MNDILLMLIKGFIIIISLLIISLSMHSYFLTIEMAKLGYQFDTVKGSSYKSYVKVTP